MSINSNVERPPPFHFRTKENIKKRNRKNENVKNMLLRLVNNDNSEEIVVR